MWVWSFGGRSGEHEVSLRSAESVLRAIDRKKYDVVPIGIAKSGQWLRGSTAEALLRGELPPSAPQAALPAKSSRRAAQAVTVASVTAALDNEVASELSSLDTGTLDVVFPVLHGTYGEDGTVQGMLEMAGIAYVGSGVLGSAVGMDKDAMKTMFAAAGLPIVKHVTLLRGDWQSSPRKCTARIEAALRYPVFVKPANLGSSVGISKVKTRAELAPAIAEAAKFDRKIVIEEGVGGAGRARTSGKARELEVAVLGNDDPIASVVGEIVPDREFYDYASKYDAASSSEPVIPAKISRAEARQMREMAIRAFRSCDLSGLARVDFLMEAAPEGKAATPAKPARIFLNEVNTMPGFTSISMYPKLWQNSGLSYADLIDRLIQLALERHAERKQTSFSKE